ncbi:zf-TFIIB domain-containing protein [Archangium sp.]|uniref:TFIIB-type zinc ribbon-containing protein n=1 Tax=Archangium sp. TaxID=1872627 RepID=UPI002D481925|nr:zf-TFIIB domain-containing protein [Archangium sp.]HYO53562.1 zf-TFIIB domain-containing protein [Archangium sp.]
MARPCPLCENELLRPLRVSHVKVDTCPSCHGLWFDRGELERFPDRPPVRTFLAAARQAPSRCRKRGHLVAREQATCATCRSEPVSCPSCGSRLARVLTSACPIDVCPRCEGIWLDAGGFELMEGVTSPQARPAGGAVAAAPQKCSACGVGLLLRDAFAYEGDVYCARCRT